MEPAFSLQSCNQSMRILLQRYLFVFSFKIIDQYLHLIQNSHFVIFV